MAFQPRYASPYGPGRLTCRRYIIIVNVSSTLILGTFFGKITGSNRWESFRSMALPIARHHAEWLSLLEISGPFLSMPVLLRVFPQGLDADDPALRGDLRTVYEEWLDDQRGLRPDPALHRAWVQWVLSRVLEIPDEAVQGGDHEARNGAADQGHLPSVTVAEYGETLRPDFVLVEPPDPFGALHPDRKEQREGPRLLVQIVPPDQNLEQPLKNARWKASPATRMMTLLRSADVRLGLVTNGEQWMLVHARPGASTTFVSWYAELWLDEPLTLRAFRTLLGAYRFFGVAKDETLPSLLVQSAEDQQEVTDQLGKQVRHAVELLVQAMDRADQAQGGRLLADIGEPKLYEAAVTVMMRLVFLLSAEERDLLPLDDPLYAQSYAVSTLRAQLQELADQFGEELLERRHDAWCRLLATFRAVHGGIHHDRLHLPAYGGGLFDPERFPFLEGRGSSRRDAKAQSGEALDSFAPLREIPIPIDNRTVLHLLDALQMLQVETLGSGKEARRLSFRALDIEQIGHVYEGLLDHTAHRAQTPVLGLAGTKNKEPEIPLPELERFFSRKDAKSPRKEGNLGGSAPLRELSDEPGLLKFLKEQTGRSTSALRNALHEESPERYRAQRLRAACGNDEALYRRVLPFHGLIRDDDRGYPVVIPAGSVYVTAGPTRRETGTHYTPRSLTEPIVQHTLEPLVYRGPAEGKPRKEWRLRSPEAILELKVCDMAMGSGAFLVQACRYLSERLVEALEERSARQDAKTQKEKTLRGIAPVREALGSLRAAESAEERLVLARRLVADRCLYGVDRNPLAVEMAKLSLWLITLARGKPFSFLDHALRCGDSLVGIHSLDQLRFWDLHPETRTAQEFAMLGIEADIQRMIEKRREIEETPVRDVEDQQLKAIILAEAEALAHDLKRNADLLMSAAFNDLKKSQRESLRKALLAVARDGASLEAKWRERLPVVSSVAEDGDVDLRPFHWPLEFPEIFLSVSSDQDAKTQREESARRTGFDAFVGNPPFIGGLRIRGAMGASYLYYLKSRWPHAPGVGDYSAYFFLRAFENLNRPGALGLIATNTIAQGDTRALGLAHIVEEGGVIYRAVNNQPWPGQAAVVVNVVHIFRGDYRGEKCLDGRPAPQISALLDDMPSIGPPQRLKANTNLSFIGSYVLGMGFTMTPEEAQALIGRDPRNADVLFPYLNGQDLNSHPEQQPSRWVINFFDWPLERSAPGSWVTAGDKQRKAWLRSGRVPRDYPDPVAADYPDCLAIVRERVYPERRKNRNKQRREIWWRFTRPTIELYATIAPLQRVLVVAQTSRTLAFAFVPKGWVYAMMTIVFAFEQDWQFAVMQSAVHEIWARRYASTMKQDLRYTPSDVFETFPFPDPQSLVSNLQSVGSAYHTHRAALMRARWEGLTTTYNRFHDPDESAADIARLRELHVAMDQAVAAAYGWEDLELGHGFHETEQGVRFTIREAARRQVLTRLLELNHQRYAEEVAAGLHGKKGSHRGGKTPRRKSGKGSKKDAPNRQLGLF